METLRALHVQSAKIPFRMLIYSFEKYSTRFYDYTNNQLIHFNPVGQSVYFITLVSLQWGNILSVRSKRMSLLQAGPIRTCTTVDTNRRLTASHLL